MLLRWSGCNQGSRSFRVVLLEGPQIRGSQVGVIVFLPAVRSNRPDILRFSRVVLPSNARELDRFHKLLGPSPFGRNGESVLDSTYGLSRELKPECFGCNKEILAQSNILSSIEDYVCHGERVRARLYKLYSYTAGEFFPTNR